MNNTTATQSNPERIVMVELPQQALLTFTGILRQSTDEKVRAAAQQLYVAVKKGKIKV